MTKVSRRTFFGLAAVSAAVAALPECVLEMGKPPVGVPIHIAELWQMIANANGRQIGYVYDGVLYWTAGVTN